MTIFKIEVCSGCGHEISCEEAPFRPGGDCMYGCGAPIDVHFEEESDDGGEATIIDHTKIYLNRPPKDLVDVFNILYKLDDTGSEVESTDTFFENGELQCEGGKRRSFDDIVKIVHTYFPSISDKEILDTLLNIAFLVDNTLCLICLINCSDVEQPTAWFKRYPDKDDPMFAYKLNSLSSIDLHYKLESTNYSKYGYWEDIAAELQIDIVARLRSNVKTSKHLTIIEVK